MGKGVSCFTDEAIDLVCFLSVRKLRLHKIFWDANYSSRSINLKGTTVFRVDLPDKNFPFNHINTVEGRTIKAGQYNPSDLQKSFINKAHHLEISDDAYNILKNFDNIAKPVRVAGKVLLVAGVALDALELGMTTDADLKDADKKIGKKTVSTVASIGGRWGGSIAGAKLGAMGGAAIGTAIFPGVGTAIGGFAGGLILGVVGAFGGDAAKWVVDITYVGE